MKPPSYDCMVLNSSAGPACRPWLIALVVNTIASALAADVDFGRDVRPVLSESCFPCHGPDAANRAADLRLDTSTGALIERENGGPVIIPGEPDRSELYRRITAEDPDERMPPADFETQLGPDDIEAIRRWLAAGADRDEHWAFVAPTRPAIPRVDDISWPRNAIDYFVLAKLERQNLRPSPEADRATLVRRLALDLTALPLPVEQADAYARTHTPDAYEKLVDQLLASPRFGERMALDWLDGARYADTDGYSGDQERSMWLWRDWVINALNRNLPFDQFTIQQLAGDLLPDATTAQQIATGFNRNHRINREPGTIAEEWRIEYVMDRVDATSTVWLGLTVACARCHSHKYDPISQQEFYELFAFFNNVPETTERNENGNSAPIIRLSSSTDEVKIAELDRQLKQARMTLEGLEKTEESDGASDNTKAIQAAQEALQAIADERHAFLAAIPSSMVMAELAEPRETFLLLRGQYNRPGDPVRADVPAALPPLPPEVPRNRLGFARWLVAPTHPLTARVAVNRYWQMYFGTGLVETDEDFGAQGAPPSHPLLLDWLATEFVRSGWDIKRLQKLIVTSATYRQSSKMTPAAFERDPHNRHLGRASRFRLPAETIRDQALAASGLLVTTLGGPPVRPYQPPGVWEDVVFQATYVPDVGEKRYRRSLYTFWKRTVPPPAMKTFDAPDRETCKTRRTRTNTPLQALALMNDLTYVEAARALGRLIVTRGGATDRERLRSMFRQVLIRNPSDREADTLQSALDRYRRIFCDDPSSAHAFVDVDGSAALLGGTAVSELAAYTAVASILFNLEPTITRE